MVSLLAGVESRHFVQSVLRMIWRYGSECLGSWRLQGRSLLIIEYGVGDLEHDGTMGWIQRMDG